MKNNTQVQRVHFRRMAEEHLPDFEKILIDCEVEEYDVFVKPYYDKEKDKMVVLPTYQADEETHAKVVCAWRNFVLDLKKKHEAFAV